MEAYADLEDKRPCMLANFQSISTNTEHLFNHNYMVASSNLYNYQQLQAVWEFRATFA